MKNPMERWLILAACGLLALLMASCPSGSVPKTLVSLSTSEGAIALTEGVTAYAVSVGFGVESLQVRAVLGDESMRLTVNGLGCDSGDWSPVIDLAAGSDTAITVAISPDTESPAAEDILSYVVTVTRSAAPVTPPAAKVWHPVVQVGNDPNMYSTGLWNQQDHVTVAENEAGDTIAIWKQLNSENTNDIFLSEKTGPGSWGMPVRINISNYGVWYSDSAMSIDIDKDGDAVIAWMEMGGSPQRYHIYAKVRHSGAWGSSLCIDADSGYNCNTPDCSIDGDGDVIVVWSQESVTTSSIYGCAYNDKPGSFAWSNPVRLNGNTAYDALYPQVDVNEGGTGLVAWHQSDDASADHRIYVCAYSAVTNTFGASGIADGNGANDNQYPRVGVFGSGTAMVLWTDATRKYILGTTVSAGVTPAAPSVVSAIDAPAMASSKYSDLDVSESGRAVATWAMDTASTSKESTWGAIYNGSSWGAAAVVSSGTKQCYQRPYCSINEAGLAAIGSIEYGAFAQLFVGIYDGTGWAYQASFSDLPGVASGATAVSINQEGDITCLWSEDNGKSDFIILAAEYF